MSFGHDILAALPELRARAEELMTDTVRIGTPGPRGDLDEQGNYAEGIDVVYEGIGKYKSGSTAARAVDAQSSFLVTQDDQLHLPLNASAAVEVGMVAIVLTSLTDPALPGTKVTINGFADGSYRTARRFSVALAE